MMSTNVDELTTAITITLLPLITELFEMVLLTVCEPVLESDPLQLGFDLYSPSLSVRKVAILQSASFAAAASNSLNFCSTSDL